MNPNRGAGPMAFEVGGLSLIKAGSAVRSTDHILLSLHIRKGQASTRDFAIGIHRR